MALRREVDYNVGVFFFEQPVNRFPVADIRPDKAEAGILHHGSQSTEVSRVGQLVQAYDPVVRILFHHVENKVASNESGAAGNNDRHFALSFISGVGPGLPPPGSSAGRRGIFHTVWRIPAVPQC